LQAVVSSIREQNLAAFRALMARVGPALSRSVLNSTAEFQRELGGDSLLHFAVERMVFLHTFAVFHSLSL
jgi:hypothetical protein